MLQIIDRILVGAMLAGGAFSFGALIGIVVHTFHMLGTWPGLN